MQISKRPFLLSEHEALHCFDLVLTRFLGAGIFAFEALKTPSSC